MHIRNQRLYYADSYLRQFSATVTEVRQRENDEQGCFVQLDRTAFYPTSGGQPHDTGQLGGHRVLDVFVEAGHVVHLLDGMLVLGRVVEGYIDWDRRFDHMQQHSGQHILSACFEQMQGIKTISFHMGDEALTIDVEAPDLSWETINGVVRRANEKIWDCLPVSAEFTTVTDLDKYKLRQPPKVTTDIRIVSIGDFDDNACGGTHVSQTGAVGQIIATKMEKVRGCVRLSFYCGERALCHNTEHGEIIRGLSAELSSGASELSSAVHKLRDSAAIVRKERDDIRLRWLDLASVKVLEGLKADQNGDIYVAHVDEMTSMEELRGLTQRIMGKLQLNHEMYRIALCLLTSDNLYCCFAVSARDFGDFGAKLWLATVTESFGGKGGGTDTFAQVTLPPDSVSLEVFLNHLQSTALQPLPGR